ncbi:MAG TPA: glycosyltransferase [Candidatus Binatia bacterium]|nr:glycosyltransferase [Candidatus Binatia bacterium]
MTPDAPRRPRLLVLTSSFPRWPQDTDPRFVADLCTELAMRFEVHVLAPHCRGAATAERIGSVQVTRYRYCFERAEVLAYGGGMLPNLRRQPWRLLLVPLFLAGQVLATARLLRTLRPDVVHAHWLIPQGLCALVARALAGSRAPLVCTAHGADVLGLRGSIAMTLLRQVARRCDAAAGVSEPLRERLVALGAARSRTHVLPMGVPERDVSGAREPELVAFAGRLVEKKGARVLLEAFARLARQRPRARLVIAGDGPEAAALRLHAGALGVADRVAFAGAQGHEAVLELFERATVAAMPSVTARDGDSEGLGLVMLEAMSCGCPVVASSLAPVRTVIEHGVNGWLVPEGDAAALADALARLLEDAAQRQRLAQAARETVRRGYSWARSGERYAALFEELLAASSKRS